MMSLPSFTASIGPSPDGCLRAGGDRASTD
jgi:hypothetical protein